MAAFSRIALSVCRRHSHGRARSPGPKQANLEPSRTQAGMVYAIFPPNASPPAPFPLKSRGGEGEQGSGGAEERGSMGEEDEKRHEESVLLLFVSPSSLFLFSAAPLLRCSLAPLLPCSSAPPLLCSPSPLLPLCRWVCSGCILVSLPCLDASGHLRMGGTPKGAAQRYDIAWWSRLRR